MTPPSDDERRRAYALVQAELNAIGPHVDVHVRRGRVVVDALDVVEGGTLIEAIDKLKAIP